VEGLDFGFILKFSSKLGGQPIDDQLSNTVTTQELSVFRVIRWIVTKMFVTIRFTNVTWCRNANIQLNARLRAFILTYDETWGTEDSLNRILTSFPVHWLVRQTLLCCVRAVYLAYTKGDFSSHAGPQIALF
jgi:hypothetical protein